MASISRVSASISIASDSSAEIYTVTQKTTGLEEREAEPRAGAGGDLV